LWPERNSLTGHGKEWEAVDHNGPEDEFYDMEWYQDSLYLATSDALYQLVDEDEMKRVDMKLGKGITCGHLHANDGVLWSFGTKHVCFTEDGKRWRNVTP